MIKSPLQMSFSLQHSLLLLKVFIPLGSMSKTKRSLTNLHVLYTSPYAYDGSYPFGHFLTHFNKVSVWASFFLCPFGHFYLHFPFCTSPRFSVSAHAPTTVWAPAPSWRKQLHNQGRYSLHGQSLQPILHTTAKQRHIGQFK